MSSNLGHSIRLMLSSSLRGNGSIGIRSTLGKESTLQLTQDDARYEDDAEEESQPGEDHIDLKNYLDDFADALKKSKNDSEIADIFNEKLSQMVYGSNMIEAVGSSLDITSELCRDIFAGGIDADDVEISDRDPTYKAIRAELREKKKSKAHEDVLRTRCEIIQHAKAAYYMMNEVAIKGRDLSEEVILETHRLLTCNIDSPDGIPSSQYGGIYRKCPVQRGFHSFPHQSTVPKAVRDLTASLKADIAVSEASGEIDSVALAAKYCHKSTFTRFLMDATEREEYMDIATEGFAAEALTMQQEEMDDLPEGFKPKHHKKLATFTLKHVYKYFSIFN
ncbi:hypothetical protein BFJ72_g1056 [Fusarium proliferatum]|uniref:Uncharacterized protein n=1 Tax=Gibberella intermedia TaxID=948311 RepID=A0A420U7B4_GIBIN|nr:hypothetical protein BFJ72_g1056 [Fusarium proliferatum]